MLMQTLPLFSASVCLASSTAPIACGCSRSTPGLNAIVPTGTFGDLYLYSLTIILVIVFCCGGAIARSFGWLRIASMHHRIAVCVQEQFILGVPIHWLRGIHVG